MSAKVIGALERILEGGGEPDDVLREAVQALADGRDIAWAGIAFLDQGTLVLGPAAGRPDESQRVSVPIVFQGSDVGELRIDGRSERAFLERAATLLAGHVLIGWDTRGEPWEP